ncbi:hypothetical protein PL9214291190 [Planktothrix tepida PCC 9214]|uniref:Uncharacterized protein n=1 Tax=Planktothrix tepida PCC 9214 TaxID=671072 RepID=A0A1J1LG99_9CYAN|nr:hypothetical protein PL9214291190 [Planktothrix tepida PCC 9214]
MDADVQQESTKIERGSGFLGLTIEPQTASDTGKPIQLRAAIPSSRMGTKGGLAC